MIRSLLGTNKKYSNYKSNVMTPVNWGIGIIETILIPTAAMQHTNWLGIGCFILASFVIVFYFAMYTYFALKSPDRLQSEQFNLAQQEFHAMRTSDQNPKLNVDNKEIFSQNVSTNR